MDKPHSRKLGWIGLGRIGRPMAERLMADGYDLAVFDISPDARNAFAGGAARIGKTAADVARDADAILFCVSDAKAVEDVVFGADGVLTTARPGALAIDHSSTPPDLTRRFAERARGSGAVWIDAPVSGGPAGAEERRLAAWLGGDEAACIEAQAILRSYCATMNHMGASGSGQVAKSCNQAIVANTIAIWSEMLNCAKANRLDLHKLIDTLAGSSADSTIRKTFAHGLADGRFPELSTRNMIKDLEIVSELATKAGCDAPHASLSLATFRTGIAAGLDMKRE